MPLWVVWGQIGGYDEVGQCTADSFWFKQLSYGKTRLLHSHANNDPVSSAFAINFCFRPFFKRFKNVACSCKCSITFAVCEIASSNGDRSKEIIFREFPHEPCLA